MAAGSRRLITSLLALAALSCRDEPAGIDALPVVHITVAPSGLTLAVGASAPLTATVRDLEGDLLTGRVISWSSSDPTVAQVSPAGVVTAIGPGVANIGAFSDQSVGLARVVVQTEFRLPVLSGQSTLLAEIGTPTPACPSGEGGLRADGTRDCRHSGISRYSLDLRPLAQASASTLVVAAADGRVDDVCIQPPSEVTCGPHGPFVFIVHESGLTTFYAHLDPASVLVRRKMIVAQGEPLGSMGAWGAEGYPWLHFEVRLDNKDSPETRILDDLVIEGRTLTEYRVGQ